MTAAPADNHCSMAGTFSDSVRRTAGTMVSGAAVAFLRKRSGSSCPRARAASTSTSAKAWRALPWMVTKRQGFRPPWSGARTARSNRLPSSHADGAGSMSGQAEKRPSRASTAGAPMSLRSILSSIGVQARPRGADAFFWQVEQTP